MLSPAVVVVVVVVVGRGCCSPRDTNRPARCSKPKLLSTWLLVVPRVLLLLFLLPSPAYSTDPLLPPHFAHVFVRVLAPAPTPLPSPLFPDLFVFVLAPPLSPLRPLWCIPSAGSLAWMGGTTLRRRCGASSLRCRSRLWRSRRSCSWGSSCPSSRWEWLVMFVCPSLSLTSCFFSPCRREGRIKTGSLGWLIACAARSLP